MQKKSTTAAPAKASPPNSRPAAEVISLKDYRALREDGHRPDLALRLLRDMQFKVGDIVRDRQGDSPLRVIAVERYFDETVLAFEGDMYGGTPMYDAQFYVHVKRGGDDA